MPKFRKLLIAALIVACSVSAFAQSSAKDVLTSIGQLRAAEYKAAQDANKTPDLRAIDAKVKAKAEEAIKDLDVDKLDAKDAYDWAQVYQMAGRDKDVCALMHKFLTTNPTPDQKFSAQLIMMRSCNNLGEADMLMATLKDIRPVTAANSSVLANFTANQYADTIAKHKSKKDAIATLEAVERGLPKPDFEAVAKDLFENDKKRRAAMANPPEDTRTDEDKMKAFLTQAHTQFDTSRLSLLEKKAELLAEDGKTQDAVRTMEDFIKTLDATSPVVRSATLVKNGMTLNNSAFRPIGIERGYGNFPGLDKVRGKVVVVDFFAHWCGPCRAAFPDMRNMLADLKDKGLEMVGVTTYYGYFGRENVQKRDMPKDTEFEKMDGFIKEQNITWPVVYTDRSSFDNYGVRFIPTVVLIDKKGIVREVHVGYDKEGFAKFRQEVEKLLNEK